MGLSLGSITNSLFGGTQSNQNQYINPAQNAQLGNLYGYAGGLLNQYQNNPQSLIAGFTQPQIQGQNAALSAASGPLTQMAGMGGQAWGQALNADPTQSPFFAQSLQASYNPFIRNFMQSILPGIRGDAVGVGQAGSSRQGIAQGMASQGLLQQLGDMTSQMGQNAYNTGAQQRLGALGMMPQIMGAQLAPAETMMNVGGQQQAMNQQFNMAPWQLGGLFQGLLGSPTVLGQQTSNTSPGLLGGLGNFMGNMGGMMSGAGSMGARF
jgi:hypothetical protein